MKFTNLNTVLYLFFIFVFSKNLSAQTDLSCDSLQITEINELIKDAKLIRKTRPFSAKKKLEKALEIHPEYVETYYLLACLDYEKAKKIFKQNPNNIRGSELFFLKAEQYFKDAYYLDSTFNRYSTSFFLGEFHFNTKEYLISKSFLDQYIQNNNFSCDTIDLAKKMLKDINFYFELVNNPVPFNPKPVQSVCTKDDEYLPYISPDGKIMYYTHRFNRDSRFSNVPISIEEFSYANRLNPLDHNLDKYTTGKTMSHPFNQGNRDQGGISITIDNKCLFITICTNLRSGSTSYKNCDIYSSNFVDGKWSPLKKLGPNINSDYSWEGQPSVTADGKGLFFASARKGGYGGMDIYRSRKDAYGNWGRAQNLGSTINTKYDEKTPFVHTDSQTLYFSSNGHLGIGGFDIFYSQYLGLGKWGIPVNIGYPINTEGDNLAFIVSTNGQKIYFSSNNIGTKNGYDIYSAPLYERARPQKVLFVNGKLSDEFGHVLGNAEVELQNVQSLKLTKGLVDSETGEYAIAIAMDSDDDEFILTVKKQGYYYSSKYIKPSKKMISNPPTTMNFEVRPIQVGTKLKLENIYFDFNSSNFNKKSMASLNNFAEFLILNSTISIELLGHTDNVGEEETNLILSENRAEAVFDYLREKDIEFKRIKYKGLGEKHPIATNSTKKGRKLNRRTEFIVTIK